MFVIKIIEQQGHIRLFKLTLENILQCVRVHFFKGGSYRALNSEL